MTKGGESEDDPKYRFHARPALASTRPAVAFPPAASESCKATYGGDLAGPEWESQQIPSRMADTFHGSERSEVAATTLQLASPSTPLATHGGCRAIVVERQR